MKLDTKRTVLVGFAFLSICAFWQMYDNLVPLILTNTFHLNEEISGAIMAADNILALFLLPLFGGLSDRCKSRLGKRRPYIMVGTILAILFMMLLPVISDSYYAAPAKNKLLAFIVALGLLLVAMGIYRSPAVALMPDVTPKPLRSKANAIINLMGAVGGVLYLIITTFLYTTAGETYISYLPLFAIVGGIMLLALLVLLFFVNEPKLAERQLQYEREHPDHSQIDAVQNGDKLPKDVKISLGFLLVSIALWYIGYNGVTTWFTVYAQSTWNMSLGTANLCLTVATVGAIVSYIPVGMIASKVGRRKTILFGTILLAGSFFLAFVYTLISNAFSPVLYVLFVLVGIAWAAINVNSLPMVVEMCKGSDVGKFTGLYYTFSMSAQIVTPVFAGFLLRNIDYKVLFPYAAIFTAASCVTMLFVKHGDNKIEAKTGLDAYDIED